MDRNEAGNIPDTKSEDAFTNVFDNPFEDVKNDDWFYTDVEYTYENGMFQGLSDSIFGPNATVTRAMLVTVLWRMEKEPVTNYAISFSDVADGEYYTEDVRWAASNYLI